MQLMQSLIALQAKQSMSVAARSVVDMEEIAVTTTPAAEPLSFVRDGRTWPVGPAPVRWFGRVSWWDRAQRMPLGQHARIDNEVCRVQARIGTNPRTPLVTFELVRGQDRETWSIRSKDAIAA